MKRFFLAVTWLAGTFVLGWVVCRGLLATGLGDHVLGALVFLLVGLGVARLVGSSGLFKASANECGSWLTIKTSFADREWWLTVDQILHAVERLPIPNFVWEVGNWRSRFCIWATMRYDDGGPYG